MRRRHALITAAALCSALALPHVARAQATPADPEFQKVLQASSAFLAVADSGGIYTPMK